MSYLPILFLLPILLYVNRFINKLFRYMYFTQNIMQSIQENEMIRTMSNAQMDVAGMESFDNSGKHYFVELLPTGCIKRDKPARSAGEPSGSFNITMFPGLRARAGRINGGKLYTTHLYNWADFCYQPKDIPSNYPFKVSLARQIPELQFSSADINLTVEQPRYVWESANLWVSVSDIVPLYRETLLNTINQEDLGLKIPFNRHSLNTRILRGGTSFYQDVLCRFSREPRFFHIWFTGKLSQWQL